MQPLWLFERQPKVEDDLDRGVSLEVLERVPHGEPSPYCHQMVISRKENRDPRRAVGQSSLYRYCLREVHSMHSPFELAKVVPANTWHTN